MNINKLLAKIVEVGMTKPDLAKQCGISLSGFYKKIRGESAFDQREISMISRALGLTREEITSIFFEDVVS